MMWAFNTFVNCRLFQRANVFSLQTDSLEGQASSAPARQRTVAATAAASGLGGRRPVTPTTIAPEIWCQCY
jgi:hypothetical protein